MTFRMANFVASLGSASGELTGSAHKIGLNSYKNQSIIPIRKCQSYRFGLVFVICVLCFLNVMAHEIVLVGFYLLTLIYSVILHEVSHGLMALWLGDLTAKYADRLNLNPMKHIDPFGSIVLPVLLFVTTGFAFGWAKPVPYNPYNLSNQKWGPTLVALAGPVSNLLVASLAALIAAILPLTLLVKQDILGRFIGVIGGRGEFLERFGMLAEALAGSFSGIVYGLLLLVIFWNVVLACFNLLPIPPLDGSKILYTFLPLEERTILMLEQYGLFLLIFVIFFFSGPIGFFINSVLGVFLRFTL